MWTVGYFKIWSSWTDMMFVAWLWHNCIYLWMIMSGATAGRAGRKDLNYELRETSLLGNDHVHGTPVHRCLMVDKAVQFETTMELGHGDSPEYILADNSYNSSNTHNNFEHSAVSECYEERSQGATLPRGESPYQVRRETVLPLEASPAGSPRARREATDRPQGLTQAVVEDVPLPQPNTSSNITPQQQQQQQGDLPPCYKTNESNPAVPSLTEHCKTSTLRISDRTRSESEDDIEKMEESEPDGAASLGSKGGARTNLVGGDKRESTGGEGGKEAGWQEGQEPETDCTVQCLYYAIQCCECTIL